MIYQDEAETIYVVRYMKGSSVKTATFSAYESALGYFEEKTEAGYKSVTLSSRQIEVVETVLRGFGELSK